MNATRINRKRTDEDLRYITTSLRAVRPGTPPERVRAAGQAALAALDGRNHEEPPEVLSQADLARFLKCSRWTVGRLARTGQIRAVRIGGLLRFRRADVEALFAVGEEAAR